MNEFGGFLVWELFLTYPTLCWKEILVFQKNKGTPLWNFPLTLENFAADRLIAEVCYQLSSTNVDAESVINWAVVGQLSSQYLGALTVNL